MQSSNSVSLDKVSQSVAVSNISKARLQSYQLTAKELTRSQAVARIADRIASQQTT